MKFLETTLPGVTLIELEPHHDERGFFARSFCVEEFVAHGLHTSYPQGNTSFNQRRGTLRGMHYQLPPHGEVKVVRCTAGAIYDVVVDLRRGSPTRFRWFGAELSAASRTQLYIPEGFAHGFITLTDDTEVEYRMGAVYVPGAAGGFRWNEPRIAIEWPLQPTVLSERDASYPDLEPELAL